MPMKVVVCFESVRVTVPCGEGEIPVQELINKAIHRYKRAVGKGANHRVEVFSLKTISGGGILDPDDQLCDVVDDREQLIAEFEEENRPSQASLSLIHHHHNGGDGASVSSTGTTSPEPFGHLQHHQHLPLALSHHAPNDSVSSSSSSAATAPPVPAIPPPDGPQLPLQSSPVVTVGEGPEVTKRHDSSSSNSNNAVTDVVVVTPRDLSLGSTLKVRRGSEPNLATLVDSVSSDKHEIAAGNLRPLVRRRESVRDSDEPRSESSDEEKLIRLPMTNSLDRKKIGLARFTRDSLRSSLSSRPEMYRWLEAQQRAEEHSKALQVEVKLAFEK
ncbi:partitioning defective 3-like protein [Plakobranchus ocellatus]|uniref:Partitioning defective 3-like protein n=1 Tax=Plakobranchus ocellatus TaxID=259542 RepID=A0AAV4BN93_9GAST|nr:partitioning defective 3-like protein [Plakobranchus ocellatus]